MRQSPVPRPRHNRVAPDGTLHAHVARGLYLGNRGDLHGADGTVQRAFRLKAWICCTLEERNGRRVIFDTKGRYTPLFFADEAVALAAGHRPCAQCRHADYQEFRHCFHIGHGLTADTALTAGMMDKALHEARIDRTGTKIITKARLADLPDGTFMVPEGNDPSPALLWRGRLHPWSFEGYGPPQPLIPDSVVSVLTPGPILAVLSAGYVPKVAL